MAWAEAYIFIPSGVLIIQPFDHNTPSVTDRQTDRQTDNCPIA